MSIEMKPFDFFTDDEIDQMHSLGEGLADGSLSKDGFIESVDALLAKAVLDRESRRDPPETDP